VEREDWADEAVMGQFKWGKHGSCAWLGNFPSVSWELGLILG
jgi:hypothetical protein